MARVLGLDDWGVSADAAYIDSPSGSPRALPREYPAVGHERDAVVQEIDRYQPALVCSGGDGISIDVRSADGRG